MKTGDKVRIIRMDNSNGRDFQAEQMTGVVGIVQYVDSAGQVHLEGYGLALIPGVDDFTIINE